MLKKQFELVVSAFPRSRNLILGGLTLGIAGMGCFLCVYTSHAAVDAVTIFSPSNGRNLSFRVYTPPGYTTSSAQHYPVVISLHGIGGTGQQRANTYFPTLDTRMGNGEILPMIWLFPDGQNNSFYGDAFDGHKQVYSHIIHEALPYVDSHYRTIADRGHRAMEGFSMGGYGAAMFTAKHPELFSAVVEQGGALSKWENLVAADHATAEEMYDLIENNFLPYSLYDLTTANAEAIRTQVNYKMIVGDADFTETTNERFRDHLLFLGIDPHYQVLPGVTHLGGTYLSEGSGLRFLNEHFASTFRREGDYDRDGDTDATDYATWRLAFGSTSLLSTDGNENGAIDAADYVLWRKLSNAAAESGGQASAAWVLMDNSSVPEPTQWVLVIMALPYLDVARRRKLRRDVLRHTIRVSRNVCHNGHYLARLTDR